MCPGASRARTAIAGWRSGRTYKLFIGGAFPRSESGRSYPVTAPDGTLLAHAALASRKRRPGRRGRGPQGLPRLVRGDGLTTAAGPVPGRRNARRPGGAVHPARLSLGEKRMTGLARPGTWRRLSTGGSGTRAGRTRSRRSPGRQRGCGPVLQPQRARADRGRGGARATGGPDCSGWSACSRRSSPTGSTAVLAVTGPAVLGRGQPGRGAGHFGCAGWRGQRADRAAGESWPRLLAAHQDVNSDRPDRRGPGGPGGPGTARGREREAGICGRTGLGPRGLGGGPGPAAFCWPSWRPRRSGTRSASSQLIDPG